MMICKAISFMVFRQRPNMPSYLRPHLLLEVPFGLLSMIPTLILLLLAILTPITAMAKAKVARVNLTPITLAAPLTLIFVWHY